MPRPDQPRVNPTTTATQEAASKARGYYVRDRDALRRTFLAGHSSPFTGAQLRQKFVLDEWVDTDALAAVVDAETVAAQARLQVLADEYMAILDAACDAALLSGPSEIVDKTDAKTVRRENGEVHRMLVESGDVIFVYRLRVDDPGRLALLREETQGHIKERERVTIEALTAIMGEMPKRKSIVDPFHKKKPEPAAGADGAGG